MGVVAEELCLSSVHVYWSAAEAAYVARSDEYPDLVIRNEWSSLAAIDGLIELIEHGRSAGRPASVSRSPLGGRLEVDRRRATMLIRP